MKAIFKYPLEIKDEQQIEMYAHAFILSVKEQNNEIVLYAKISHEEEKKEMRTIYIFGTGHDIPNTLNAYFLDTVMTNGGRLVWHIFVKN